jgi:hypothetical protein
LEAGSLAEKEYLILLDVDARKRHYHFTEAGAVVKFVVQLEVKWKGAWKPVLRYDCSHDYAHKDCYNLNERRKKISLYMDYQDALIFADDDINENWQIYRERFLKGDFP